MAGAGSTSSSTTHTLTLGPGTMSVSSADSLASMAAFLQTMQPANRHVFLQPPPSLTSASLQFAKEILDSFAGQVGDEQQLALRAASKKRKREGAGAGGGIGRDEVLKIRKLHVEGFNTGQVWQQAKRILASTLAQSKEVLQDLEDNNELEAADVHGADENADALETDSDDDEVASDVESAEEASDDLQLGEEEEEEDEEDSDEFESAAEEAELSEVDADGEPLGADEGEEDGVDDDGDVGGDELNQPEEYAEDPDGLNDGFFSIDDFNKQSIWFEDQDARADPNTDQVDEKEEVNWHADPFAAPDSKRKKSTGAKKGGRPAEEPMSEPEDDDEDAGPTFGDMALDAPEGASDDEMGNVDDMGMGLDLTANDIFYKDFFAPPAKKGKKGFQRKARASRPEEPFVPAEGDVERAMADVRRDLFDDLSEQEDSDDALSEASAGNPKARKSAHERRLAKLAAEIGKLERENVEKRKWTLSGEAAAMER
ncbi:MAG: hypothetical protein OK454_03455, partial [Thaumarchaeota archaeon]|nr:hypothetical protein [Nitrososphaerota archaeon]